MIRMSEYVPGQQTATRYHGMRLVNKHNDYMYIKEQSKSITHGK